MKHFSAQLSPHMTNLINEMLVSGVYRIELKIAKVVPVFKKVIDQRLKITDLLQHFLFLARLLKC